MLLIEEIDGGFRITEPAKRWTWWVYPSDLEIRNNGERYKLTGQQVAPRLTLPQSWTLGDVVNAIVAHNDEVTSRPSQEIA